MKIVLTREEIVHALEGAVLGQMKGGNWVCTSADYTLPREMEFVDATPEYLAEKEAERVRREEYVRQYEAEVAAKKVAVTETTADPHPDHF